MNNERVNSLETGHERQQSGQAPGLFGRLRSLFGLGPASVRDDIQDALEDLSTEADFSPLERAMLKNVLTLHDVRVEDVMIPRADILAVELDALLPDVLAAFRMAGHSRLPVHAENLDDPRGMVHIRDFLDFIAGLEIGFGAGPLAAAETPAASAATDKRRFHEMTLAEAAILRPVLFVPPSMPALDLLVKMQTSRTHMALVIDEYGGTDGLVSIEDIVEVIVGDIEDEHDEEESPQIEAIAEGQFVIDARASLDDVARMIGKELDSISDAEDVDTLGGLITSLAGHVPLRGEILTHDGIEFEVLDADPRRVKRIKINLNIPSAVSNTSGDIVKKMEKSADDAAHLPHRSAHRA
jgi:CBS domain containing-hemolysin-like protein